MSSLGFGIGTMLANFHMCVIMLVLRAVFNMYVGGYGGLSENGLCVFRELCPVSFLVVGESPSVLV